MHILNTQSTLGTFVYCYILSLSKNKRQTRNTVNKKNEKANSRVTFGKQPTLFRLQTGHVQHEITEF